MSKHLEVPPELLHLIEKRVPGSQPPTLPENLKADRRRKEFEATNSKSEPPRSGEGMKPGAQAPSHE